MKILYLHQYFVTPAMSGGTRSYEMARRFVEAGHEVHVITSDTRPPGDQHGWRVESVKGITVHWYPVPYENGMSFAQRILAFFQFARAASLRAARIGGDVVFATSTPLTIAIPAIFAKFWLRVPMVFEVRDLWPEMPIAVGALNNPIAKKLARWLEWWAYRNSDQIVALSPGMADGVRSTGYARERVHVIPNACDLELFNGHSPDGGGDVASSSSRPVVLYAGTFGLVNDVPFLADVAEFALRIDPDVTFVAKGSGAQEHQLRSKAAAMGILGENFHVEAPSSKREMPSVLAAASVCVSLFAPIREMEANSANKFFDALAAGKPVVINYGGWQERLLDEHGAGLRISRDPERAARQLLDLVRDPERLDRMGRAARILAETNFARNDLARDLLGVLIHAAHS